MYWAQSNGQLSLKKFPTHNTTQNDSFGLPKQFDTTIQVSCSTTTG